MFLTPNELRNIIKLLQEGKPLPDEYRFKIFEDKREVELVWNGKTNEVTSIVLPFQIIEQVDEPRSEKPEDAKAQLSFFDFDQRGRQIKGWTNKLIWGDNKLILSSLKNGPLREEIEKEGGIKLIYIDPPFDVGADFSIDIEIGDETLTKEPSVLEELAYRDTWGKGADSWIAMMYERLILMRDLLAEDGSIYVHCDWRVSGYLRLILDEVFGKVFFVNEILWCYTRPSIASQKNFSKVHDTIFWYSKTNSRIFNSHTVRIPYAKRTLERNKYAAGGSKYAGGTDERKTHKEGKIPEDWWVISISPGNALEIVGYPTQKPKALLERIIKASSNEGDLVADFFCGSGTTLAVAEEFGRKWIGSDLSKFAIHTTRKRMISVQRELKASGKNYRAFEVLNLGKYERQLYAGINPSLSDDQQKSQLAQKEKDYIALILRAYKAQAAECFNNFVGKKNNRVVAVGPVDLPVGRNFVLELLHEAQEKGLTKIDVLAFEFEMGLFPHIQEEARDKGIDLSLKYIPRDVFDKRAVEKNQVIFHDVAYIEVKPHIKGGSVAVELTDFSVFYNQDTIAHVESELKNGSSKLVVEAGQIIKVAKDKNGIVARTVLTQKWTDWIDYWAVDFDFENKKEIIRVKKDGSDEYEEVWTGDYIFENEWQSFRTKKNRQLELVSVFHECPKGRRKIAVKVVDIFGNDTMKVIELGV